MTDRLSEVSVFDRRSCRTAGKSIDLTLGDQRWVKQEDKSLDCHWINSYTSDVLLKENFCDGVV